MANLATRLIDRFVGAINPDAGMRRLRARELLTRAYEGASQKDGWRPRRAGASANTDHLADGGILRTRARALVQNVPYIARGLESLVANTVGCGITPRSLSKSAAQIDGYSLGTCRRTDCYRDACARDSADPSAGQSACRSPRACTHMVARPYARVDALPCRPCAGMLGRKSCTQTP